MQVLPTAPSPTVTHFMNLEALIFLFFLSFFFWVLLCFLQQLNYKNKTLFRLTFCCLQTQAFGERERKRESENKKMRSWGLKIQLLPASGFYDTSIFQSLALHFFFYFLTFAPPPTGVFFYPLSLRASQKLD